VHFLRVSPLLMHASNKTLSSNPAVTVMNATRVIGPCIAKAKELEVKRDCMCGGKKDCCLLDYDFGFVLSLGVFKEWSICFSWAW
jgi:hypothetical protein